jgi:hypothetical protein
MIMRHGIKRRLSGGISGGRREKRGYSGKQDHITHMCAHIHMYIYTYMYIYEDNIMKPTK